MWHARYIGPVGDYHTQWSTWREARDAVTLQIKTVAPLGTYATLIVSANEAKPDIEWSVTDGVHTFSISQADDTDLDSETIVALLLDEPLPGVDQRFTCAAFPNCGCQGDTDLPCSVTDTREHSELGGSIVERFGNCPGSVRLIRGLPNPETPAAKRGTAAHEVAHLCLLNGQDAIEFIGRTVNDIEIDSAIAEGVQTYLDDCRACPATETFYEVRFTLESFNPPAPMFGTADFVGYDALEQRLYVKDYKNGFKFVDATGNKQLRYYALGALIALGDDKPVSDVHVTICQPNALGATLKTDTFDAVELVEWSHWLMDAARVTQDPNAPVVAGLWCDGTFCPARGSCAARAAHALAAAQIEFTDYLAQPRMPEVRLLSAAERGAIYGAADGLRAFLSAVEDSIRTNTAGTGWKLVPTDTRQAWRDKDAAAVSLSIDHGLDPYEPAEVISPAVARGKIAAALHAERVASHDTGKKPTKKDAEQDARKALASLIVDISSGTKLVPEADPRPAISTGGAEFDNIQA